MKTVDEILDFRDAIRCEFCESIQNLRSVDVQHPILPNTFNDLKDIQNVIWKCNKCGCWNH